MFFNFKCVFYLILFFMYSLSVAGESFTSMIRWNVLVALSRSFKVCGGVFLASYLASPIALYALFLFCFLLICYFARLLHPPRDLCLLHPQSARFITHYFLSVYCNIIRLPQHFIQPCFARIRFVPTSLFDFVRSFRIFVTTHD